MSSMMQFISIGKYITPEGYTHIKNAPSHFTHDGCKVQNTKQKGQLSANIQEQTAKDLIQQAGSKGRLYTILITSSDERHIVPANFYNSDKFYESFSTNEHTVNVSAYTTDYKSGRIFIKTEDLKILTTDRLIPSTMIMNPTKTQLNGDIISNQDSSGEVTDKQGIREDEKMPNFLDENKKILVEAKKEYARIGHLFREHGIISRIANIIGDTMRQKGELSSGKQNDSMRPLHNFPLFIHRMI